MKAETKTKKWGIEDAIRLEFLAERHERLSRVSIRSENEANRLIYKEVIEKYPEARKSRRVFWNHWTEIKWKKTFLKESSYKSVDRFLGISGSLTWVAFVVGVLVHWLWGKFDTSLNVFGILFSHSLIPFFALIVFLAFGGYFAEKTKAAPSFFSKCKRIYDKLLRKRDAVIASSHDLGRKSEDKKGLSGLFYAAYSGACRSIEKKWAKDKIADENEDHESVQAYGGISIVLKRKNAAIQQWILLQIQAVIVAYLAGFLLVFVTKLLTRSAAFTWGTTLNSVLSADRVETLVHYLSLPWQRLFPPPTFAEISATQAWFGDGLALAKEGWEAWALFLMMAILTYALIPRICVVVIQRLRLRYLLKNDNWEEIRYTNLWDAMAQRSGFELDKPDPSELELWDVPPANPSTSDVRKRKSRYCLVISNTTMEKHVRKDAFDALIHKKYKMEATDTIFWLVLDANPFGGNAFQEKIRELSADYQPLATTDLILYIVDAEQPPKSRYQTHVQKIREAFGTGPGIVFYLWEQTDNSENMEENQAVEIWRRKIRKWGDVNTGFETLRGDLL